MNRTGMTSFRGLQTYHCEIHGTGRSNSSETPQPLAGIELAEAVGTQIQAVHKFATITRQKDRSRNGVCCSVRLPINCSNRRVLQYGRPSVEDAADVENSRACQGSKSDRCRMNFEMDTLGCQDCTSSFPPWPFT